jgi:hypothetical protein
MDLKYSMGCGISRGEDHSIPVGPSGIIENTMSPIKGTVENGNVRLVKGGTLRDGQKVIVIPLPSDEGPVEITREAEQEDIEFVRASRGRLARQLDFHDHADA